MKAFQGIRNPRQVTFAAFDGRDYPAIAQQRRSGIVKVDYFVTVAGRSVLVTAHLERHQAKARLAEGMPS